MIISTEAVFRGKQGLECIGHLLYIYYFGEPEPTIAVASNLFLLSVHTTNLQLCSSSLIDTFALPVHQSRLKVMVNFSILIVYILLFILSLSLGLSVVRHLYWPYIHIHTNTHMRQIDGWTDIHKYTCNDNNSLFNLYCTNRNKCFLSKWNLCIHGVSSDVCLFTLKSKSIGDWFAVDAHWLACLFVCLYVCINWLTFWFSFG